jgi:hypothetical protein
MQESADLVVLQRFNKIISASPALLSTKFTESASNECGFHWPSRLTIARQAMLSR